MTQEHLHEVLSKVHSKYIGKEISPALVGELYYDMHIALTKLHSEEHFLNFSADFSLMEVLVHDEESMSWLGLFPYLDTRLMNTKEVFVVNQKVNGSTIRRACGVVFKDLYTPYAKNCDIGFDVDVYPIIPIGILYPDGGFFKSD